MQEKHYQSQIRFKPELIRTKPGLKQQYPKSKPGLEFTCGPDIIIDHLNRAENRNLKRYPI